MKPKTCIKCGVNKPMFRDDVCSDCRDAEIAKHASKRTYDYSMRRPCESVSSGVGLTEPARASGHQWGRFH